MSWSAGVRLNCVVPIVPASTAIDRTRVECETNRVSHASCDVWKMSKPKRTAHGMCETALLRPPPMPLPPVSVKPNVGRVSGCWLVVSTSNSHTGKLDSVPPSMIVDTCVFASFGVELAVGRRPSRRPHGLVRRVHVAPVGEAGGEPGGVAGVLDHRRGRARACTGSKK